MSFFYSVTHCCKCGASLHASGLINIDAAVDLTEMFLRTHIGPKHGTATREQAARARRRQMRRARR